MSRAVTVVLGILASLVAASPAQPRADLPPTRPILFVRFVHYLGALSVTPTIYSIRADGSQQRSST
jgi:hypothetical protein